MCSAQLKGGSGRSDGLRLSGVEGGERRGGGREGWKRDRKCIGTGGVVGGVTPSLPSSPHAPPHSLSAVHAACCPSSLT
jgi:hypothetical protein